MKADQVNGLILQMCAALDEHEDTPNTHWHGFAPNVKDGAVTQIVLFLHPDDDTAH